MHRQRTLQVRVSTLELKSKTNIRFTDPLKLKKEIKRVIHIRNSL